MTYLHVRVIPEAKDATLYSVTKDKRHATISNHIILQESNQKISVSTLRTLIQVRDYLSIGR